MQRRLSAFMGYTIEAPDGHVGSVSDVLFDDNDWKLRWFVIDIGSWLSGRQILIRPAALGQPDIRQRAFPVTLTKSQVEAGPAGNSDLPVSQQMEPLQNDFYFYGPMIGGGYLAADEVALSAARIAASDNGNKHAAAPSGDPHLRSFTEVKGYHIHALDGDIGHLEDFLIDDAGWTIDTAVVNTKNWGFGSHVLVPITAIKQVNWLARDIHLEMTRYKIKCSPTWQDPDFVAIPPTTGIQEPAAPTTPGMGNPIN